MKRRKFLVASAASLALPSIAGAQGKRVLKFIPQSDLAILDPIWTTAYATRNHGYMVFDTLYGQSGEQNGFKTTPQMVAGHVIEDEIGEQRRLAGAGGTHDVDVVAGVRDTERDRTPDTRVGVAQQLACRRNSWRRRR